jgi:hypothetical protein
VLAAAFRMACGVRSIRVLIKEASDSQENLVDSCLTVVALSHGQDRRLPNRKSAPKLPY